VSTHRSAGVVATVFFALLVGMVSGEGAAAQGHPPLVSPMMQPMTLSDAQVTGFFGAVEDLQAYSEKNQAGWKAADPSKPMAVAGAMQVSAETTAIVQKHGFKNHTEFQRVAYNASMAYAVLKEGGKEAMQKKLAAANAEQEKAMAQLRERLGPEQAAALTAQMQQAMKTAGAMQDVPEANIELMKKYSDRMAKLGGK
jgi:hypothetical protein